MSKSLNSASTSFSCGGTKNDGSQKLIKARKYFSVQGYTEFVNFVVAFH